MRSVQVLVLNETAVVMHKQYKASQSPLEDRTIFFTEDFFLIHMGNSLSVMLKNYYAKRAALRIWSSNSCFMKQIYAS